MSIKDLLPKGCPFKMPASVKPMHDETSNRVTDQANTETSFGQGIDTVDTIDDSLGSEGSLEQEVCCTLQGYDDKFDVDHAVDSGTKMDVGDGDDVGLGVEDDIVIDDIDVADDSGVDGIDERDIENGNVNDDKDDEDEDDDGGGGGDDDDDDDDDDEDED
ncbi:hypothetical protein QLX08_011352 [Tetragonisca angustula]|uniref:Uncharacterized protein n=1 Tax=Tetragonisca angustula TaxID=166442 RepID=A0AAW0Z881_9HYME